MELLAIVDDFVFGFILRQQHGAEDERAELQDPDNYEALFDYAERLLATGEFPHLRRLLGEGDRRAAWRQLADSWGETRFAYGLERLLDGIELDLRRRGALPDA